MNLGKFFLVCASLLCIAASVVIYFRQAKTHLIQADGENFKVKMDDYDIYRYKSDQLTTRFSGRVAILKDQGRLYCEEQVKGVRFRSQDREEIEAKRAVITFENDNFFSNTSNLMEVVELFGDVEIFRGTSHFRTDWLRYTEKTGEAFTDKPVRMDDGVQFIAAEQGMTYNIRAETLKLRGGVFGAVTPDTLKKSVKP